MVSIRKNSFSLTAGVNSYNEAAQLVTRRLHSTNYYGTVSNGPQSITENSAITARTSDIAGVSIYLNPGFSFTASATTTYSANIGAGTFAHDEWAFYHLNK